MPCHCTSIAGNHYTKAAHLFSHTGLPVCQCRKLGSKLGTQKAPTTKVG